MPLVIDLSGYIIYPGFIDTFTNYAIYFEYLKTKTSQHIYEIKRIGGNAENGAIHSKKKSCLTFFTPRTKSKNLRCKYIIKHLYSDDIAVLITYNHHKTCNSVEF